MYAPPPPTEIDFRPKANHVHKNGKILLNRLLDHHLLEQFFIALGFSVAHKGLRVRCNSFHSSNFTPGIIFYNIIGETLPNRICAFDSSAKYRLGYFAPAATPAAILSRPPPDLCDLNQLNPIENATKQELATRSNFDKEKRDRTNASSARARVTVEDRMYRTSGIVTWTDTYS